MINEVIHVPESFLREFPELDIKKANKFYNKYLNVIRRFMFRALPHIEGDTLSFPLKQAFDMCGEFQYKNVRYYVWKEFIKHRPFFTIYEDKIGTKWSGVISEVRIINQKYIDLLIDTADTDQLVETCYSKYDRTNMVMIPIDMSSLVGYITKTEHSLHTLDNNDARLPKLQRNLRTAKYFKLVAEYFYDDYGDYMIPHVPSDKTDYGRTFYKGINLQNCTKEVRSAALGDHVSYDLNAAAYAIKLILAKEIFDEFNEDFYGNFTYTKEYLDHKGPIRSELANVIHQYMPQHPNTLKLVKEAMTAIGFGAKVHEGSWESEGITKYAALHYIIYNKEARTAFVKHPFVSNFLREQNELNKLIYEYFSRDPFFIEKVKDIPNMCNNNGKLLRSKVLAYLYQHSETQIMDIITENIVPLIRIHDCFITKKPIKNEQFVEIRAELKKISEYLDIMKEDISGWTNQQIIEDELRHKKFITQEELNARNYESKTVIVDKNQIPIKQKKYEYNSILNDSMCYDGYDDGSRYDEYDVDSDETIKDMTLEEKREHYRIVGHQPNSLPDHLKKLL